MSVTLTGIFDNIALFNRDQVTAYAMNQNTLFFQWLKSTSPKSTFVSLKKEMLVPIGFAGRRLFFDIHSPFNGDMGYGEVYNKRLDTISILLAQKDFGKLQNFVQQNNIHYIAIPSNDAINTDFIAEHYTMVFKGKEADYIVYQTDVAL